MGRENPGCTRVHTVPAVVESYPANRGMFGQQLPITESERSNWKTFVASVMAAFMTF